MLNKGTGMRKIKARLKPLRIIHSYAPLRINDIGGWTDTWFSKQGKVLNLAVLPPVEVQIRVFPNEKKEEDRVLVHAENYGETFRVHPERPSFLCHPLLQFTIASLVIPKDFWLEISLFSPVPAGISAGTSASVCVALLGALAFLSGKKFSSHEIASLAHRVETEKLKQQSGIQDQICAAYGGVCFIDMYRYPFSRVLKLKLQPRIWEELNRRICFVYLGKPHLSSVIHEKVIALLEKGGEQLRHIERMKKLAEKAKEFLVRGDLGSYGRIMVINNECQKALYAKLISEEADSVMAVARKYRASGWKVNGAGGKGGSMTILANSDDGLRRKMIEEINSLGRGIKSLPVSLSSSGLRVWESE